MDRIKVLFVLVLFVCAGFFVYGCSQQGPSASEIGGGTSYFPHNEGNSWIIKSTDGTTTLSTFEGTTVIGGSITVQNCLSSRFDNEGNLTYMAEEYYRADDTGVYLHGNQYSPLTEGLAFLQFPLEVGKSWTFYDGGYYSTIITVAGTERISVPAGTFDCYIVSFGNYVGTVETYTLDFWVGNGVGIAKSTSSISTHESVLEWKNF
ncbi:hypothetical protein HQ584_10235 [Patescibacteria group bacterium]|nr:hypothetical protein [Patescibacteria group bacterium]